MSWMLGEEGALLGGRGRGAGRARDARRPCRAAGAPAILSHSRSSAAVTSPGLRLDCGPTARRSAARCGLAPRASACSRDFEHQEGAERAERQAADWPRAPRPARTCPSGRSRRTRRASGGRAARQLWRRRPARCRSGPASMRASAMRTASTPAASSPMKVRDEPVTPCTIEMLPASRLESCARNSVGRRSLISRSLRKASRLLRAWRSPTRIAVSTAMSRSPPPAATIMSVRARSSALPLMPARFEREARRIGADALPRLHLALVALLRDLLVEVERRERVHDVGREGGGVGLRMRRAERLPMRVRPFAEARDDADAGDPGLARARQPSATRLHREARCAAATSCMLARNSPLREIDHAERDVGVADGLAVAP